VYFTGNACPGACRRGRLLNHRGIVGAGLLATVFAVGCSQPAPLDQDAESLPPDTAMLPLTDAPAGWKYLGRFEAGLYPGGNTPPEDHLAAGRTQSAAIRPLDPSGQAAPDGRYVLLSIGMSNTTQEFCSQSGRTPCDDWTFMGRASADPAVDNSLLVIANGARGGQTAPVWASAASPEYDRIRDQGLTPLGLSERQVQIVWLKVANSSPRIALPAGNADAFQLLGQMGQIARALKQRYPNLRLVFVSSRIYAGYASTALNPEPYAYESGYAVKWLIEAQISQLRGGTPATATGDLAIGSAAPWIGWGPYLWARGTEPRSDGLVWLSQDFQADGTHPGPTGRAKVGALLLDFFRTAPLAHCWFLAGHVCSP
jgi:hypothetical protein